MNWHDNNNQQFLQENSTSKCGATRVSWKLESHHSYYSLWRNLQTISHVLRRIGYPLVVRSKSNPAVKGLKQLHTSPPLLPKNSIGLEWPCVVGGRVDPLTADSTLICNSIAWQPTVFSKRVLAVVRLELHWSSSRITVTTLLEKTANIGHWLRKIG